MTGCLFTLTSYPDTVNTVSTREELQLDKNLILQLIHCKFTIRARQNKKKFILANSPLANIFYTYIIY